MYASRELKNMLDTGLQSLQMSGRAVNEQNTDLCSEKKSVQSWEVEQSRNNETQYIHLFTTACWSRRPTWLSMALFKWYTEII